MLKNSRDGIHPEKEGEIGPLKQIADLQAQGQGGQVRGLGIRGLVDSRGDAVGKEVDELCFVCRFVSCEC